MDKNKSLLLKGANSNDTADYLKAFNKVIEGLFILGADHEDIFSALNATTDIEKEYLRLLEDNQIDLVEIACTLDMARSLLFGVKIDWENTAEELYEKR